MNLHLVNGHGVGRAPRSGQPWEQDDYETLVELCRQAQDAETIAAALGRTAATVMDRARRMLPVDERGLPRDRALHRLAEHLRDPDYDWDAAMVRSAPPAPVEHRVYRREGVEGLRTDELLAVAELLALLPHGGRQIRTQVMGRIERDIRLVEQLEARVGRLLVDRAVRLADEHAWLDERFESDHGYRHEAQHWYDPRPPGWDDDPVCGHGCDDARFVDLMPEHEG
ncbi:hypothetical protein [Ornithinimicrobium tianjinense]|uniref:Uncharacterized protein n=1 Tax=Ornithinimicrobium tianjinense TaxID=1195761 RepID=A0A917BY79_9MICO|nr:hypothetical protein [Ornithinimicrobium tianjinense]GGF59447.1 hypothetical protein GCM10011366_29120 [Ornithinimicrobium tianjinense]